MQPSTAWLRYAHARLGRVRVTSIRQAPHLVGRCDTFPSRPFLLYFCQHQRRNHYQHHQGRRPCADGAGIVAETTMLAPKFAAGSHEASLTQKLEPLLASATTLAGRDAGRWTLTPSGTGLERSFKFKTFAKTWDFMTAVALQCKLKNHHPEWSNVYNRTIIRWTTHNPPGLSAQDIELASMCDILARDFGELMEEKNREGRGDNSSNHEEATMRHLADTVSANAEDCCTPKKKSGDS